MMNEAHDGLKRSKRTRLIGRLVLPRAHAAGVRHLAAEALSASFAEKANRTRQVPEAEHGYLAQPDLRELLQAALDLGWALIAYEAESGQQPPFDDPVDAVNWREAEQGTKLANAVLELGPDARVLVWCGNSHLSKQSGMGPGGKEFKPMARVFWDRSELEPFSIDQTTTVDFDGTGSRGKPWLERYEKQLRQSAAGALGLLRDEPSRSEDAIIIALDNLMQ
jgi:hypothetical protein